MSSFTVCLNAVLPIFIIMALGYIARLCGAIKRSDVPRLNKLAFFYFLPLMLFNNIYSSDLSHAVQPKLLVFAAIAVLVEYGISFAYVMLTEKDNAKRSVKIQGMYRSNFVIIGIPLAGSLVAGADLAPVVMMISVVVPMYNIIAVITLEMFGGVRPKPGALLVQIIKNPLIIGTVVGVLFLLTGIKLPEFAASAVAQIGAAANPLMLFLLGAFFEFGGLKKRLGDVALVSAVRLVVMPAIFLTLAALLGFGGVEFAGLIAVFASATAIASFTMVQQMGGDDELAGDIVVATSAFCPLTMFLWSFLFKSLGVF